MTTESLPPVDYFAEAALLARAAGEIAQQPDTPDKLREHLNDAHGYTIPADADVARWFSTLSREHEDKHRLARRQG